jgi:hypothetical protein
MPALPNRLAQLIYDAAANQRLQIRIGCVVDGGAVAMEATECPFGFLQHTLWPEMP